jgi:hypothetical protein
MERKTSFGGSGPPGNGLAGGGVVRDEGERPRPWGPLDAGPRRPFYPRSPGNVRRARQTQVTAGPDLGTPGKAFTCGFLLPTHDPRRPDDPLRRMRPRVRGPRRRPATAGRFGRTHRATPLSRLPLRPARPAPPQPPGRRTHRHAPALPRRLRRLRPRDPPPLQAEGRPAALLPRLFQPPPLIPENAAAKTPRRREDSSGRLRVSAAESRRGRRARHPGPRVS